VATTYVLPYRHTSFKNVSSAGRTVDSFEGPDFYERHTLGDTWRLILTRYEYIYIRKYNTLGRRPDSRTGTIDRDVRSIRFRERTRQN